MLPSTLHLVLNLLIVFVAPRSEAYFNDDIDNERHAMHYTEDEVESRGSFIRYNPEEETAGYWRKQAQLSINRKLSAQPIKGVAKNVILFLGDGLSIPTITAARAYLGQESNRSGEEMQLSFEKFPFSGLSKTYCVDEQVADSACSATAYLCGIKANYGTIGVTAAVQRNDCEAMKNATNHVHSIGRWSQLKGKRTGVVTTTRITHASPSGVYAHTANRDWENDADLQKAGVDPEECPDIATQLVHGETGKQLNVMLGGGRTEFLPWWVRGEDGKRGLRRDGRNLIDEWKNEKGVLNHEYIYDRIGLLNTPDDAEYVLGLFDATHLDYNIDRDPTKTPSLLEMTEKAIKLLSKGKNGYFLFVEGGRIDHAHHSTNARKALNETIEFHKAIQAAVDMTNPEDTLIVVTSDHAHTMSVSGYPKRGNDVLGIGGDGRDKLPYATLSYANGPGYRRENNGKRHDISKDDLSDPEYKYPALVPRKSETHGGDDVGIFAYGPWAHLLTGVNEQNIIPHVMAYASCVGDGITVCDDIYSRR